MRFAPLAFFLLLFPLLAACAPTPPPPTPPSTAPTASPRVITEAEARTLAVEAAAKAGYPPATYGVRSITRVTEGTFAGAWAVFFEHAPPVPPGGHATVYVRPDGSTQVMRGE